MLSSVRSFELSSGAFSETYALGSEAVGASVETTDVAGDGARELLSLAKRESEEGEFIIK